MAQSALIGWDAETKAPGGCLEAGCSPTLLLVQCPALYKPHPIGPVPASAIQPLFPLRQAGPGTAPALPPMRHRHCHTRGVANTPGRPGTGTRRAMSEACGDCRRCEGVPRTIPSSAVHTSHSAGAAISSTKYRRRPLYFSANPSSRPTGQNDVPPRAWIPTARGQDHRQGVNRSAPCQFDGHGCTPGPDGERRSRLHSNFSPFIKFIQFNQYIFNIPRKWRHDRE